MVAQIFTCTFAVVSLFRFAQRAHTFFSSSNIAFAIALPPHRKLNLIWK